MTPTRLFVLLLFPTLLPAVARAQAVDSYYITVFGSGTNPLRVKRTHTFATFSHVRETPAGPVVENHTISWMPATLNIRPFVLRRQPGVNLTQDETFRWTESMGMRTSVWGPFTITPERFDALLARKADLESGRFSYRAIGGLTKDAPVSNCGQSFPRAGAVGQRYLQPTPLPGEPGTSKLVDRGVYSSPHPVVERPELLPAIVNTAAHPVVPREPGERIGWFRR